MSDLIKRSDAIEAILADLKHIDDCDPDRKIMRACIRRAKMKIESLPPWNIPLFTEEFIRGFNLGAQTQTKVNRPQGVWIDLETMDEWYGHVYKCSVCGRDGLSWNYCPHCGTRMKAEQTELSTDFCEFKGEMCTDCGIQTECGWK